MAKKSVRVLSTSFSWCSKQNEELDRLVFVDRNYLWKRWLTAPGICHSLIKRLQSHQLHFWLVITRLHLTTVFIIYYQEYNFSITTDWKGAPIDHAPIEFQISALDSNYVRIHVTGPFFDNPGPPPCKAGSACSGLWDYEGRAFFSFTTVHSWLN